MAVDAQSATASAAPKTDLRHEIVIIGGGNGGISVAARLRRALGSADIAIVEPSDKHYYQPLWTLVGGGVFPKKQSEHSEASVIPPGTTWIRDSVTEIDPDKNLLVTGSGKTVTYQFLVVAPGIQINWDKIKGLTESLGKNGVSAAALPRRSLTSPTTISGRPGSVRGRTSSSRQPTPRSSRSRSTPTLSRRSPRARASMSVSART